MKWIRNHNNKYAKFLKQLIYRIREDNVTAIGAQLSYFLVLSLFPFIIFFLNILSFTPIAREDVLHNIIILVPVDLQRLVSTILIETITTSNASLLSLSAITGIWAASKGIMALIRVLNKAYDVEETRAYLELRLVAIIFTLALLALLAIVLLTLVFGEVLGNRLFEFLGIAQNFISFWEYFRILISLFSMIFIFTLMYRYIPSIKNGNKISFKHAFPGAVFSTVGWIVTSSIFSYYVNNFVNYSKTYGSLGGIVILLIWIYLSSIIVILGGEINATLRSINK
ncbi:MAG TPA: YihY/virulence factor BrkB family protein [Tissierellaceae bacterium]